jgi:hypothetical protein
MIFLVCLLTFAASGELKLGKPLTQKTPLTIAEVLDKPAGYVGKTIQVKGKITEVCQMMGCWMNLADPETGKLVKIKVDDGDLVFPKESVGKMAIAEGKLVKFELTREQATEKAKHEAEEQGRKFNPNSIKSGATIYQIQGTGAMVLE